MITVRLSSVPNKKNTNIICVCSKPGPRFPMPYVMVFLMFNGLMLEVVVCFVDIGGIADRHCLNFLFIIIQLIILKLYHKFQLIQAWYTDNLSI